KNTLNLIRDLNVTDRFNQFSLKDHGLKFYSNSLKSFSIIHKGIDFLKQQSLSNKLSIFFNILKLNDNIPTSKTMYKRYDAFYTQYLDLLSRSILNTDSNIASAKILNRILRKLIFTYD